MKHLWPETGGTMRRAVGRCSGAFVLAMLMAGLWSSALPAAQAQDGMAAMKKMMTAYQSLTSYEGHANTEDITMEKKQTLQRLSASVLMQYKKPNRLRLSISTLAGDHDVYSDGVNLWVYDTITRTYTRAATEVNLSAMLPLLAKQAGITTSYDPLFFLSGNTLPKELTSLKAKDGQFNGHTVTIVTGQVLSKSREVKYPGGQKVTIPAFTVDWTWIIDKKTNLLRRSQVEIPNLAMQSVDKKQVVRKVQVTHILRQTTSVFKADPPLDEKTVFRFTPPNGSKEAKSREDQLGK